MTASMMALGHLVTASVGKIIRSMVDLPDEVTAVNNDIFESFVGVVGVGDGSVGLVFGLRGV